MTRVCPTCEQRPSPRLYAGRPSPCKECRHAARLAYWRQRDADRDLTPEQIEAAYLRAVWLKNPRKAQALKGRAA